MRLATSLLPTLREEPADAEARSHRLMLRAGLVRQLAAGIFVWLPLGHRVLERINAIIREEMNAIGGQEITMPVLHPAEIWKASGRWEGIPEMFKLQDRHGRDLCLGMTHEEVVAWLAAREVRSHRDLPQIWYQIQTKERDEARPRSGVLRTREFVMKDSYTLDPDEAALDRSYAAHEQAYRRIFTRCGLTFHVVQSDTGMMGGHLAHEFMAPSAAGEDEIAMCGRCGYAANVELARAVPLAPEFPAWSREEIATPGARTIAEVASYLGVDPRLTIKSLLYVAPKAGPVLVLLRGDHQLHERKLLRAVGEECRPAHPDEVRAHLGAPVGSIGPLGVAVPVVADETLREGAYIVGANREGYHVRGVSPARDVPCRFADLHVAAAGEGCPRCGAPLAIERVIEIGNIFKLGTKFSEALGATYLDESGAARPIVMGSYGIGPARIAAAAIEQGADADGIVWPASIAPFHVHIVIVSMRDPAQVAAAEELYAACARRGLSAILDDRDERPGVKFKDADLLGMPVRVTIGNALVREGVVEIKERRAPRREHRVPPGEALDTLCALPVLAGAR
ncbi:MAG TPA: proline--tRNA ligase [Candidatus Tectomicrobia bacterium]|nr:proline--tRNA ligase [Candidatus Tectomicrobia bacterium]